MSKKNFNASKEMQKYQYDKLDLSNSQSPDPSESSDEEPSDDDSSQEEQEEVRKINHKPMPRCIPESAKIPECVPSESEEETKICNKKLRWTIGFAILFSIVAVGFGCLMGNVECDRSLFNEPSFIDTMSESLVSGIEDTKQFQKPSILLYTYTNTPESYIDELLSNITIYASCSLTQNGSNYLELTTDEFTTPEAIRNYGHLIVKYEPLLREKKVMLVKHLENIPGSSAQIFHTFCDEISPIVHESLFIFSLHIQTYNRNESDYKAVEQVLRSRWSELTYDVFHPLLTRISSIIIKLD